MIPHYAVEKLSARARECRGERWAMIEKIRGFLPLVPGEAGAANSDGKKKKKGHARETIEAIAIAIILALIIRTFVLQAFKIPSSSMEDTLLVGDHLLVNKFSYGLQVPRPAMVKILGITVPFFETKLVNLWGRRRQGGYHSISLPERQEQGLYKEGGRRSRRYCPDKEGRRIYTRRKERYAEGASSRTLM